MAGTLSMILLMYSGVLKPKKNLLVDYMLSSITLTL